MKTLILLLLSCTATLLAAERQQVLIVTGEPEYGSATTLGRIGRILQDEHDLDVVHLRAEKQGETDHLPGLQKALAESDLLILYLRFLILPEAQVTALADYMEKGGNYFAVRTSTHPFRYPAGHPLEEENEAFPLRFFGTPYRGHHGHQTSQVNSVMIARHPILRGVEPRFWTPDFVYGANPLAGQVTPLVIGQALQGTGQAELVSDLGEGFLQRNHCHILAEKDATRLIGSPHPVVWTIADFPGRGLVSTIGARKSFDDPSVTRLFLNGAFWCLGREAEIPPAGLPIPPGN
ncbi:ThuA domain-containing protein [Roseibacillus ishigakijimensis]|uniref:ThuA domain-containing protein n=1 Tax=Roseibacillus ishigakijimensis TaxID=454146 RepID=A0A934VLM2_9BACT|nr:ThuA domain-containing protein [Roseibacillus ishigakijimensis]MBK1833251.1 ThuA domain-containing protein [Roseibacillus ishigakijimensis]